MARVKVDEQGVSCPNCGGRQIAPSGRSMKCVACGKYLAPASKAELRKVAAPGSKLAPKSEPLDATGAVILVVLVLLVGGCVAIVNAVSGDDDDDRSSPRVTAAEPASGVDNLTMGACLKYRSELPDILDGVLTDAQVIERLQGVWDLAKLAEDAEVRADAQRLLQLAIDGDPAFGGALDSLAATCERAGAYT